MPWRPSRPHRPWWITFTTLESSWKVGYLLTPNVDWDKSSCEMLQTYTTAFALSAPGKVSRQPLSKVKVGRRGDTSRSNYPRRTYYDSSVLAGRSTCARVHLLLSVHVMSVFGKESKPFIIPCSSKVHLVMVRSNGLILTSIGIPFITSITVLFRPNQVMFNNVDTINVVTNNGGEEVTISPGYYTLSEIIAILNTMTNTSFSISTMDTSYEYIFI